MIGPGPGHPVRLTRAHDRNLLSRSARTVAAIGIVTAVLLMAALCIVYAGSTGPGAIDRVLDPLAASTLRNQWFDAHDSYFLRLGDAMRFTALTSALVIVASLMRRWAAVALLVVSPSVAVAATELVIAPFVGRRLQGVLSLPSGHATAVGSAAVCVVVLVLGAPRSRVIVRWSCAALVTLIAFVSGVAVVAEGTHYATDVVAGWCVAVVVVLSTALLLDRVLLQLGRRFSERHSDPPR